MEKELKEVKDELKQQPSLLDNFSNKIDNWGICDSFCSNLKIVNKKLGKYWIYFNSLIDIEKEELGISTSKEVNKKGYHFAQEVKEDTCIGCAACATVCPDGCISVYKVKE